MNENIQNAIDLALSGKINDMGNEIESALMQKVSDAIAGKRVEVASSILTQNENEEPVDDFEEDELEEYSVNEKTMSSTEKAKEKKLKAKYDDSEMKAKMIKQYGPEKGESIYFATIRKQAMGESVEELEEISKKTLGSYIKKAVEDKGTFAAATGRYAERSRNAASNKDYMTAKEMEKMSDKAFQKSFKREKGIKKAADKLSKD